MSYSIQMMKRIFLILFLALIWNTDSAQAQDTIVDGIPFKIHEIQARETLFAISRKYNVDLNQLVIHNPVVIEGLFIGYPLLIPINNLTETDDVVETPQEQVLEKQTEIERDIVQSFTDKDSIVRIALLLPFFLDLNDSLQSKNEELIYPKSNVAIDFYAGFQIALDTLSQLGYNIDIMLLDVPNDSVLQSALNQNLLYDRDYIFGPLYIRQFEQLANYYGYDKNKTLISPLSQKSVTGKYLNVFQATPTAHAQIDSLIYHFTSNFPEDPIVILGHSSESDLLEYSKEKLNQQILLDYCSVLSVNEEQLNNRDLLKTKLNENRNVVLVPSNNRSFVSRVLPILAGMQDTSITVFGLESWNNYDNLDFDDLEKLNVHLPKNVPNADSLAQYDFIDKFIRRYNSFPSKYASSAYWQGLYFLSQEFKYLFDFKSINSSTIVSSTTFDLTQYVDYEQIKN